MEDVLTQALLAAPMFTARWRWNASRALAVLRFRGGRKVPPPIQRMRADDLLAAVFPDQAACAENLTGEIRIPDHPLVNETIANCLHEAMDLEGLKRVLDGIAERRDPHRGHRHAGAVAVFARDSQRQSVRLPGRCAARGTPRPRRADAPHAAADLAEGVGALDAAAIAQVAAESWPVVRDADELHDALLTLITLPPVAEWQAWFDELTAARRVTVLHDGGTVLWVAAEKAGMARAAHFGAGDEQQAAVTETLRGWLESTGPMTASALAERLALPARAGGRGAWRNSKAKARSCAASSIRTARRRNRVVQPPRAGAHSSPDARPPAPRDRAGLDRRFHALPLPLAALAPGSQLHGLDGALQVIRQLQGYEISAAAWESEILPRRIARYSPDLLDQLCLSGEVMWGRLSPHPAFERAEPGRVRPTRVAPLAIFLREDAGWLLPAARDEATASRIRSRTPRARCWRSCGSAARHFSPI